jgi:aspartate/tyrosine/aromatic aminotransferase
VLLVLFVLVMARVVCVAARACAQLQPTGVAMTTAPCLLQALSGTGSLRVGAAFIARWMKGATVYISNPTWGNHRNIFGDEGVEWKYYRCV